jgi:hypothetical protein
MIGLFLATLLALAPGVLCQTHQSQHTIVYRGTVTGNYTCQSAVYSLGTYYTTNLLVGRALVTDQTAWDPNPLYFLFQHASTDESHLTTDQIYNLYFASAGPKYGEVVLNLKPDSGTVISRYQSPENETGYNVTGDQRTFLSSTTFQNAVNLVLPSSTGSGATAICGPQITYFWFVSHQKVEKR